MPTKGVGTYPPPARSTGFWVGHRDAGARRISPCHVRRWGVKRGREPRTLEIMTAPLACSFPSKILIHALPSPYMSIAMSSFGLNSLIAPS
jgi:hypothetical protein